MGTTHNKRKLPTADSAVRVPQNHSQACALCAVSLHHILRSPVLPRKPLFATENVSCLERYMIFIGENDRHIRIIRFYITNRIGLIY